MNPTNNMIPDDFESQARHAFDNLRQVLHSAGADTANVVKTTVYMTDLSSFDRMNELYVQFFGEHKPARTTIGVAALPQFPGDPTVLIEVEAIAEMTA